jgi:tetratricopeptide (TPR) repeat protein
MMRAFSICALLLLLTAATAIRADRLHLESGGYIDTDSWWVEDDWLMYENEHGTVGIPRSSVIRIERGDHRSEAAAPLPYRSPQERATDADVEQLRELMDMAKAAFESRDFDIASSYYMSVITSAPKMVAARIGYAASEAALGRDSMALSVVQDGLALDPDNARLREFLGDLRYREDRVEEALQEWKRSFDLAPADRLRDKILKGERELHASRDYDFAASAHFNLIYDGDIDLDLAAAVMDYLEEQYWKVTNAYRHGPPQPITVQLLPKRAFREVTQSPEWVGGLYDGKIRVPLGGLEVLTHRAKQVLVHELTHAVIHSKSRGNCPRWLHEGLAQRAESKRLTAKQQREISAELAAKDAADWDESGFSYPMALSLTRHLESRRGFEGLVSLLDLLAEGRELDEALRHLYGEDYKAVCRRWKRKLAEEFDR